MKNDFLFLASSVGEPIQAKNLHFKIFDYYQL